MLAWFWSCSGGEKGGRYCGADGSVSSEIWDGAVVYTGMLEAAVVMSSSVAGGE
jgi:hypothetical protein